MPDREQTFLIGPALYLRPVLLSDAATSAIWQTSPFPAPVETVEEQLKERLDVSFPVQQANQLLMVCRRDSDRVLGSVTVSFVPYRSASIEWVIDRLLPGSLRREVVNELLHILVPWLLEERNFKWTSLSLIDDDSVPENAIAALRGRLAYRLRDFRIIGNRRCDWLVYQFFNPVWIERLGPPPEGVEGPADRHFPPVHHVTIRRTPGEAPQDAVAIGARIYLRAFEPAESDFVGETWLQEPEHYLPTGRELGNPYTYGRIHARIARVEPPSWIRLGVVLRETGELIGVSGLRDVDWINRSAETQSGIFKVEHRNRGLGAEIKHLLLDYAFNRLDMHMVWARVNEGNDRSAAALRKQGYRDAGYLAWTLLNRTGMGGDWFFDLLGSEWRNALDHAINEKDASTP
jgi:diamine N-acetyltransferase